MFFKMNCNVNISHIGVWQTAYFELHNQIHPLAFAELLHKSIAGFLSCCIKYQNPYPL